MVVPVRVAANLFDDLGGLLGSFLRSVDHLTVARCVHIVIRSDLVLIAAVVLDLSLIHISEPTRPY